MKRVVMLIGVGAVLAGLASAAMAQQSGAGATTPSSFKYDLQGNKRVDRPDSRTVAADGTIRVFHGDDLLRDEAVLPGFSCRVDEIFG